MIVIENPHHYIAVITADEDSQKNIFRWFMYFVKCASHVVLCYINVHITRQIKYLACSCDMVFL